MTEHHETEAMFPEAAQPTSKQVECLGHIFESNEARRAHYLNRLRTALEELDTRLGGVPWTTIDDAVARLDALEHWQLGDTARLRELAERMQEAARGSGRDKDLLQLWKDEVGFPHGELEDILRLSDPPYYTACPNPFIGEFIAFYGKPYDPATNKYRREPFASDVSEGKTDSIYTAHSYHTKVPHKAIVRYIAHYTDPGDIVLDGFSGSGMTGVAAQTCGIPDAEIKRTVELEREKLGLPAPVWGSRKCVLIDLGVSATFISANYNLPFDVERFEKAAKRILKELNDELGWAYETLHTDKKTRGRINYTVWSDVLACPHCAQEIVFLDAALNKRTKQVSSEFTCPNCEARLTKSQSVKLFEDYYDRTLQSVARRVKRKPVLINYTVGNKKYEKQFDVTDMAVLERLAHYHLSDDVPHMELPFMHMTHQRARMASFGVTHTHQFYFDRQALALGILWAKVNEVKDLRLRNMLFFFVEQLIWGMSILNRYAPTHMSQSNRALNGVYYIPSQISEVSPWYPLEGKLRRLVKAFSQKYARSNSTIVSTNSTSLLSIPSNSVDYIFTDPPFGENIYYADLNFLNEAWHGIQTNALPEAIVDKAKAKKIATYQELMEKCFGEYCRVLKPGRWMTLVFHNSLNSVWSAIQEALQAAGFVVADVRTLDKQSSSYRQVTSIAVKQDLVISAYKPNGGLESRFQLEAGSENGLWDFVRTHLGQLPVFVSIDSVVEIIAERQDYMLFDRMVAFHVQRGVTVPLSASEFYAGLQQRFSERDGMYFLPEQVAEYDKKRMIAKEILQLMLLVTDEASAIQWLKQQLLKKPQSFQDLHPQFMRQIGGWSKHEKALELRDLLEQNFLVYDGTGDVPSQIHTYLSSNYKNLRNLAKTDAILRAEAKDRWYVPDPNKAGDLEKLRERALLREFAEYREAKTRKLKAFRLEAVRAGFKKAWGERDYATILTVAEKIPDNVLQEDPKLLMWYDQALTRSGK